MEYLCVEKSSHLLKIRKKLEIEFKKLGKPKSEKNWENWEKKQREIPSFLDCFESPLRFEPQIYNNSTLDLCCPILWPVAIYAYDINI